MDCHLPNAGPGRTSSPGLELRDVSWNTACPPECYSLMPLRTVLWLFDLLLLLLLFMQTFLLTSFLEIWLFAR